MTGKLGIMVCENLRREALAALKSADLDQVRLFTFASDCVRPVAGWEKITRSLSGFEHQLDGVLIIGSIGCIPRVEAPPSLGRCELLRAELCAHLFMDHGAAGALVKEGAYLLTPGWLARWREYLADWGFDKDTAVEFFAEFASRLTLLDTGVDHRSPEQLEEMAGYLSLPFEVVPVELDRFRLELENLVLRWRLAQGKGHSVIAGGAAQPREADYAMAFELVDNLAGVMTEAEAIDKVFDLFNMLFAPDCLAYLSVNGNQPGALNLRPPGGPEPEGLRDEMAALRTECAWTASGNGFMLLIAHRGERLGVLEANHLAFPEYRERYLNLALTIGKLCGLTIFNARTYDRMKQTENALVAESERLAVTLRSIGDGLISTDESGRVVLMNQVAEKLTGWTHAEAAGRPLQQVFHIVNERTRQPVGNPIQAVLTTGAVAGLANDTILIARDGQEWNIADSAAPVRGATGNIIGVVLVFRDVTKAHWESLQLKAATNRLHALQGVTEAALSHLALDDMLRELLGRVRRVLRADNATILLLSEGGESLEARASSGLEEEVVGKVCVPVGTGIAGRIAASRQAIIVNDLGGVEVFNPILKKRVRSLVGAPLLLEERVIGVIHAGTVRRHEFTEDDVQLLTLVADRAALAIERSRLYEAEHAARAEAELSRRRVSDILESVTDAFFSLDTEWRVTYVNHEAERLLRKTREELMGRSLWEHFPEAIGSTFYNEYHRAMAEQVAVRIEEYYLPLETWFEVHAFPSRTGLSVFFQDINARRKYQEDLRKLSRAVEQSPATVVITDTEGNIEYVNPKFTEVTGYSAEEAIGQNPRILKSGDISPEGYRDLWETIVSGREWRGEFHNKKKNGELYWESASVSPIRDAAGNVTHYLAVKENITERKQAEEEIKRLNRRLERRATELTATNRELESFSYSVSHDLRAPLRHIDGFSRALLEDYEDKLDEQGKDFLHRVRAASQKMGRLIDDMLMLSRVTRREMKREKVSLSSIMGRLARELEKNEPERRVEFEIQPGIVVQGDPDLLKIALDNLISNAWKFTSTRSSGKIEFGTIEQNGKRAYFVRDNGVGFDMAYVGKLFGAFQRLHAANEFPGTGIGLATVQRIVHRHGGQAWAEGQPGRGATFYFTLGD